MAKKHNLPIYCWGKATLSKDPTETPKLSSDFPEAEPNSVMCNITIEKPMYKNNNYSHTQAKCTYADCDYDVILNTKEYRERSHVYIAFVDPVPASALPKK